MIWHKSLIVFFNAFTLYIIKNPNNITVIITCKLTENDLDFPEVFKLLTDCFST